MQAWRAVPERSLASRAARLQPAPAYQAGEDAALTAERLAVLRRLAGRRRVLDVGCARGLLAAELARRGHEVVGIEGDPRLAEEARAARLAVVVGDAEDPDLWAALDGRFDAVVMAHVLEHLADPWQVLRLARERLAPGGAVVSLVPNVAAWRVRRDLFLHGRFEYVDSGILDRTHLRFFTLDTALALHRQAGFTSLDWESVRTWVPGAAWLRHRLRLRTAAGWWEATATRRWPNLCTEVTLVEALP